METYEWTEVPCENPKEAPSPRSQHSCVVHRDSLYVFGGEGSLGACVWCLCVWWWYCSRVISCPGICGEKQYNDLHEFDLKTNKWSQVEPCFGHVPTPRYGQIAVVHKDWLYVFGGFVGHHFSSDFFQFNFGEWPPKRCPCVMCTNGSTRAAKVTRQWNPVVVLAGTLPPHMMTPVCGVANGKWRGLWLVQNALIYVFVCVLNHGRGIRSLDVPFQQQAAGYVRVRVRYDRVLPFAWRPSTLF